MERSVRYAADAHPQLLLQLVIRQLIGDLPDIKIVAVNPGMCRSNLGREMTSIGMRIGIIINNYTLSRSAWNGAVNVTKAIEATESQEVSLRRIFRKSRAEC